MSRISISIRGDKTFQSSFFLFICLFLIVSFIYQLSVGWFGAVSTNGTVFVVNMMKKFEIFFTVANLENRNFKSILSYQRVAYNMKFLTICCILLRNLLNQGKSQAVTIWTLITAKIQFNLHQFV